jgi:predicted acetyltransferase
MQLVRPASEHLAGYCEALARGWSPNTTRPEAAQEQLADIAADAAAFLAIAHDPEALGPPVTLPDGSQVQRLPGIVRWMWSDEGFCGSINLRWPRDLGPMPPHVLGHIGYAVVPWQQRRGHATQSLAQLLPLARSFGLREVELTTDVDNAPSQRVITANGGELLERFTKPEAFGGGPGLRFVIRL